MCVPFCRQAERQSGCVCSKFSIRDHFIIDKQPLAVVEVSISITRLFIMFQGNPVLSVVSECGSVGAAGRESKVEKEEVPLE